MPDWISDIIRAGGYAGIVLLMLLENVFPPIPSEVVMSLAGYLVSKDDLSFISLHSRNCRLGSGRTGFLLSGQKTRRRTP